MRFTEVDQPTLSVGSTAPLAMALDHIQGTEKTGHRDAYLYSSCWETEVGGSRRVQAWPGLH